ncbi:hypothetical protein DRQ09_01855 [candidate division KSB1 bacterium]|nr:MAG: hypothetical protein DRQ09_01855 [candidate division KSB1 bacterium]
MRCKKVKFLISGYLDGILEEKQKQEFLNHIEKCENCKRELESTKELLGMISTIKPVEKAPSFYQEIMSGFYLKRAKVQNRTGIVEKFISTVSAFKKPVIIGIFSIIILISAVIYSNFFRKQEKLMANGNGDEIEFLLEEHALFAEQKLFSRGAYSTALVSANFFKNQR